MSAPILIVDDSLTVRMNLMDTLAAAGLEAAACASITEAREALNEQAFSLVILDVLLPDGDGIDLLKEIRETPGIHDTAVMLLSTEAEVHDRVRGLQTGADEYVGKPYEPVYLVARARELMRRGDAAPMPAGDSILVIDDSITFREALREALQGAGYQVDVAGTGEEGLRLAAELRPTAIIVDGVLPGADGASIIRRIRLDAGLRSTPCLLLTGSGEEGAEVRALDAGADAFARKEEDIDIVLARVSAMLRSAATQSSRLSSASLHAPKRILTVDDSETYLQFLSVLLRGAGHEVVLARSGEEALEMLAVQPVDCVLLDMQMPGIGGEEACRRIKAVPVTRDTPVIMLTALEDRDAMIRGLSAGADDYIAKSSDFEVLRARMLAQMRRRQFEDENRVIREELLAKELEAAEARAAREIAETRAALVEELEWKNHELEAFSYSVSHDLRAPLRSIDGFSQALLEDYGEALPPQGQDYLRRVCAAAQRMGQLIDDLLQLSRVGRAPMERQKVDMSEIAQSIVDGLRRGDASRDAIVQIAEGLIAEGDAGLLRALMENLLGNAWKFTAKAANPTIEFSATRDTNGQTYVIRDNGAGFDMAYADRLFAPFQRLHTVAEYPGTGIGLATVRRIVDRHGGRIWAEAKVGAGAAFFWNLPGRAGAGATAEGP
ncbi:MAG TPA: response regulator [Stellaceae bacterium]|jgi:DNA-binding response OmpR family regulator|nr:response regulator [Stellaceae bacterium]